MRKTDVTIPAQPEILEMAKKILMFAGSPYTPEQQAEIPAILAVKPSISSAPIIRIRGPDGCIHQGGLLYWWNGHPARPPRRVSPGGAVSCPKEGEDAMVPLHFGHNQIVMFTERRVHRS
jgi:hypothetical protein